MPRSEMQGLQLLLCFLCGVLASAESAGNAGEKLSAPQPSNRSILKPSNQHPEVLLRRPKRYLIFEKGSSFTFTINMGKAIISRYPRGLSQIHEATLYYDLPHNVEMLLPGRRRQTTTTTSTSTSKPILPWVDQQSVENHFHVPPTHRKLWPRHANRGKSSRTKVCRARKFHPQTSQTAKDFCHQSSRRQRETAENTRADYLLFDVIEIWARLHHFNGRHCVLRTLCEAQLLLQPGLSLFHDLLRTLINFALPARWHDFTVRRSLLHTNAAECASFYGPHCRLSFLQYFTNALHGKFRERGS